MPVKLKAIGGVHNERQLPAPTSLHHEGRKFRPQMRRGMRMFLRSAPLDPDRDKRQAWMGDPAKDAESEAFNFNVAPFYTKWMDDVHRSQRKNGTIPDVAMYWSPGSGVVWASACPRPWRKN